MLTIFDKIFNRASSRIYLLFASWVLIFHLPAIYASLFMSEELIFRKEGMLKGKYIVHVIYHDFSDWFAFVYIGGSLVAAGIITYLVIFKLPEWIVIPAYRAELEAQYERKKMRQNKEFELQRIESRKLSRESDNLEKERQNIEQRQENKDLKASLESQEASWFAEYKEFEKADFFDEFGALLDIVYRKSITGLDDNFTKTPIFRYAHTNDLIEVIRNDFGSLFINKLTDKGRFFAKRYTLDL